MNQNQNSTPQDANEREELAKKLLDDLFAIPYHPKGLTDVCGLHEKHVSQCYGCRHAKWSYIIKSELRNRLDVLNVWNELNDYILANRKSQKAALLGALLAEGPEDKIFKGGLDNGMSDQMHGFNVANAQWRELIQAKQEEEQE